jgi:YHS domain-containing protein
MRLRKMLANAVPTSCIVAMLMSSIALGESTKSITTDAPKAAHVKQLKPQTTCPVLGEPIDKNLYVDYNGKRIYVCCADCIEKVKKNPEKYIKKLESMGQGVEIIAATSTKESKEDPADTSMKGMDMKGMKMSGDATVKAAETGYWTCPMHPEVHKTASGQCPICGMNLVFKKSDKDAAKTKNMDQSKMKM